MSFIPNTSGLPVGALVPFAGIVAPRGWLFCKGQIVLRDVYPHLFEVIGEYYGAGDGVTNFNLPDGRGRVFFGAGQGAGVINGIGGTGVVPSGTSLTNRDVGKWGGEDRHHLTTPELPSHNHTFSYEGDATVDGITLPSASPGNTEGSSGFDVGTYDSASGIGSSDIGGGGSDLTHNNLPPWQAIGGWIIRY